MADGMIFVIRGDYLVIEPPDLLRFNWAGGDGPAEEIVTVTFQAEGDGTRVQVAHTRVMSEEAVESHTTGWKSCLDGLAAHWS
jgi:uncharacterized protein YndB with AHSA1/START domain